MAKHNLQDNCVNGTGTSCEGVVYGRAAVTCEQCQIVNQRLHHDLTNEDVKLELLMLVLCKEDLESSEN